MKQTPLLIVFLLVNTIVNAQKLDTVHIYNADTEKLSFSVIDGIGSEITVKTISTGISQALVTYDNRNIPILVRVTDKLTLSYAGRTSYITNVMIQRKMIVTSYDSTFTVYTVADDHMSMSVQSYSLPDFRSKQADSMNLHFSEDEIVVDVVQNGNDAFVLTQAKEIARIYYLHNKNFILVNRLQLNKAFAMGDVILTGIAIAENDQFYIATNMGLALIGFSVDNVVRIIKNESGIADIHTQNIMKNDLDLAFNSISLKYLSDKQVEVTFDIKSVKDGATYNIQISKGNDKDFKTIQVVFGSDIVGQIKTFKFDL